MADDDITAFEPSDRPQPSAGVALELPRPGQPWGRYLVIEELGRGGMGVVLRAYDPKLQREVALKLLRSDKVSGAARARMFREARSLARLSHRNVVSVYDIEMIAGPGTEAPWVAVVLEYVPGVTLQGWLKAAKRSWREVVAVFLEAGRGLQAAHAQGLLHRDFKPANVLVDPTAHPPIVKVTDFGLARAIDEDVSADGVSQDLSRSTDGDKSLSNHLTETGTVMGTPLYMAPEQHAARSVSATADQYAFCVALWAALTGSPPFPSVAPSQIYRAKLQGAPAWPKSVVVPNAIRKAITRGLAADPGERWPSLGSLLTALARDSLVRRRRVQASAAAGVLVAAAVGVTYVVSGQQDLCSGSQDKLGAAWSAEVADQLRDNYAATGLVYATKTASVVTSRLDTYAQAWSRAYLDACEATHVRGEQSAARMDLRMGCLDRAKLQFNATVAALTTLSADKLASASRLASALPGLSACSDLESLEADVAPPTQSQAADVERIREIVARASALRALGQYEETLTELDRARREQESVGYRPLLYEVEILRGDVLAILERHEAALEPLTTALRTAAGDHRNTGLAKAAGMLAGVLPELGRADEARVYAELALALSEEHEDAFARQKAADFLMASGQPEDAIAQYRRLLSYFETLDELPAYRVASVRGNLGQALQRLDRNAEAIDEFRQSVDLLIGEFGLDHPDVAVARTMLAYALYQDSQFAEAEHEIGEALQKYNAVYGPEHVRTVGARGVYAAMLAGHGRNLEAEAELRATLTLNRKLFGDDSGNVANNHNNLGVVLYSLGRFAEAEAELLEAIRIRETTLGRDHVQTAIARLGAADARTRLGRYAEAEREIRAVIPLLQQPSDVARGHQMLARALAAQDRGPAAGAEARKALEILGGLRPPDHIDIVEVREELEAFTSGADIFAVLAKRELEAALH